MVDFSDFVMPRILLYKMFESWNLTQTFYSRSLTSGWILSKNWFNMKKYWPLQIWHFWLCRYYHMNFQSHNQFFKKSFPVPLGVFRVPKSVSSTEFTPEVKFQSIKVILTEKSWFQPRAHRLGGSPTSKKFEETDFSKKIILLQNCQIRDQHLQISLKK